MKEEVSIRMINLEGSLDVGQQDKFKENLAAQIPSETSSIVVDFSKVTFIDSACLGALIALTRQLKKAGGDIRLSGLSDEVRSIFEITRLDKIFKIFDTSEEAFKSYQS